MNGQILSKLGFTDGEIKVYLALLELGNVTSGPIVDKSGISKSKVYEILERLTNKGVVSQIIEDKVKHFQAADPKKLLEMYKEKEEDLQSFKNQLTKIMPSLESKYGSIKGKQEVTVFRGFSGLKSIFNDILNSVKEKDEYLVFSAVEVPDNFRAFIDEFSKQRAKKGTILKIIFNANVSRELLNTTKEDKRTKVKTIFPEFNTPAVFNLYKNKTAILLWSDNPIGIVIENKEITNSFKKYFDVLWKIAK